MKTIIVKNKSELIYAVQDSNEPVRIKLKGTNFTLTKVDKVTPAMLTKIKKSAKKIWESSK